MTKEMAQRKAQNYANALDEKMHIYVYNDTFPNMKGHHLVEEEHMKEYMDSNAELDYIETVEPNGEPALGV
jgi:hypothetical protein